MIWKVLLNFVHGCETKTKERYILERLSVFVDMWNCEIGRERGERERKRMKESIVREKCVRDKRLSECENFAKVYECVCVCV